MCNKPRSNVLGTVQVAAVFVCVVFGLGLVAANENNTVGAESSKHFLMTGKVADSFQPYGVWYDDMQSAKTIQFSTKIAADCANITLSGTLKFSCVLWQMKDTTSGAWADFNVTITSTDDAELKLFTYSKMRVTLREQLGETMASVYQNVVQIPAHVDRSWMMTQALGVVGLVAVLCLILCIYITIKIMREEKKAGNINGIGGKQSFVTKEEVPVPDTGVVNLPMTDSEPEDMD